MNSQPKWFYCAIILAGGAAGAVGGAIVGGILEHEVALYALAGFLIGALPGLLMLAKAKSVPLARESRILQPFLQSLTAEDAQTVVAACSKRVRQDTSIRFIEFFMLVIAIVVVFITGVYIHALFQLSAYTERQLAQQFPADYAHVPLDTFDAKAVDFVWNNISPMVGFFITIVMLVPFILLLIFLKKREGRLLTEVCPHVMKELGLSNTSENEHGAT